MIAWLKNLLLPARPKIQPCCPLPDPLFEGDADALFRALADHWSDREAACYTPARDSAAIMAIEARYAVRLPTDFRAYLTQAAPRETFMDDHGIQWWAVDMIKSLAEECPDGSPGRGLRAITVEEDRYLVFADYLMWCYAWAICCSDGINRGRIALIGGDGFVAKDFRAFLQPALTDSVAIHLPSQT